MDDGTQAWATLHLRVVTAPQRPPKPGNAPTRRVRWNPSRPEHDFERLDSRSLEWAIRACRCDIWQTVPRAVPSSSATRLPHMSRWSAPAQYDSVKGTSSCPDARTQLGIPRSLAPETSRPVDVTSSTNW